MRRLATVIAALLVGCQDDEGFIAPDLSLYYAVCVDSTLAHPLYRCTPPDTAWIVLVIQNPNPNPQPAP